MSAAAADRNLLFGILALQLDFISRDQLVAAMHAWVLAKDRPLGELLEEHKALDPQRRQLPINKASPVLKNQATQATRRARCFI